MAVQAVIQEMCLLIHSSPYRRDGIFPPANTSLLRTVTSLMEYTRNLLVVAAEPAAGRVALIYKQPLLVSPLRSAQI